MALSEQVVNTNDTELPYWSVFELLIHSVQVFSDNVKSETCGTFSQFPYLPVTAISSILRKPEKRNNKCCLK